MRPSLGLTALATVLLGGCALEPSPEPARQEARSAPEALEQAGEYTTAAEAYAARAKEAKGTEAAQLRYRQASALALAGRDARARQILERLSGTATEARGQLLLARIHLRHRRLDSAHRLLKNLIENQGDPTSLSSDLRQEALDYQAQLHLIRHRPGPAFEALVARHRILPEDKQEANLARIRYLLGVMPERVLAEQIQALGTDFPGGYLRLEQLMRRAARNPLTQTRQKLNDWLARYPDHPLTSIVRKRLQRVQEAPFRLAVLLPLASQYGSVADALLRGMLAAYYQTDRGTGIGLSVFDTKGRRKGLYKALAEIQKRNYAAVIGPLTQPAARALAEGNQQGKRREEGPKNFTDGLPPTLILNTTEDWASGKDPLFQFGLDPEEEAHQVAEYAHRLGHQQAGVLYPQNDWGHRMVQAFQARWRELGGTTQAMQAFDPDKTDHSKVLKALLGLDAVLERRQQLASTLGIRLAEEDPLPHRKDLDFLFLASHTPHAHLLKPQLDFFAAGELPLLATSHVHNPQDGRSDRRDMDGIRFLQLPWFLDPLPKRASAAQALQTSYPDSSGKLERIHALGYDAYTLMVGAWRRALLRDEPMVEALRRIQMEGGTGRLTVTPWGRVQRELQWATYQDGRIVPLPGMPASGN